MRYLIATLILCLIPFLSNANKKSILITEDTDINYVMITLPSGVQFSIPKTWQFVTPLTGLVEEHFATELSQNYFIKGEVGFAARSFDKKGNVDGQVSLSYLKNETYGQEVFFQSSDDDFLKLASQVEKLNRKEAEIISIKYLMYNAEKVEINGQFFHRIVSINKKTNQNGRTQEFVVINMRYYDFEKSYSFVLSFPRSLVNDMNKTAEKIVTGIKNLRTVEVFYSNNNLKETGYKSGEKKIGWWFGYRETGELEYKKFFINGRTHGLSEKYYKTGQIQGRYRFKHGVRDGLLEIFKGDGAIYALGSYKNGQLHGIHEVYFENGNLSEKGYYENGRKVGLWIWQYENGNIKKIGVNPGKNEEGIWNWYYKNGELRKTGRYVNGTKEGLWKEYDKDGKLKNTTNYSNGIKTVSKSKSLTEIMSNKKPEWNKNQVKCFAKEMKKGLDKNLFDQFVSMMKKEKVSIDDMGVLMAVMPVSIGVAAKCDIPMDLEKMFGS